MRNLNAKQSRYNYTQQKHTSKATKKLKCQSDPYTLQLQDFLHKNGYEDKFHIQHYDKFQQCKDQ